jgi:predicted N-formylglutamate amidohydrolase
MSRIQTIAVLVTCEHASREVPPELWAIFRGSAAVRRTHRGYDIGALPIAERLAAALSAPLLLGRWSRLVVDLNRRASNRAVFSEYTRSLDRGERERLITAYHAPYRAAVERLIHELSRSSGCVLHVSVHTFTPELHGRVRDVDVGLLLDPRRGSEALIARAWRAELARSRPDLRVRLNRPYRGTSDGLTTHLRSRFEARRYIGIEVEVSQRIAANHAWRGRIPNDLVAALRAVVEI